MAIHPNKHAGLIRWLLMALLVIVLATGPAGAGQLQLIHADSARGLVVAGQLVRELIGAVEFQQDSARMVCDRAIQYVDEKEVRFIGRVLIDNPPYKLGANEVLYREESKEQLANGRAWLRDPKRLLTADTLDYFEALERAVARGHVQLHDEKEQSQLRGDWMEYLRQTGYAQAVGHPVFTRQDTAKGDSLVISGRVMEMLKDGERIQAADQVEIVKGKVRAVCGLLDYQKADNRILLTQAPRATRDDDIMRGTEIELGIVDRRIDHMRVRGQGSVVSRVDTTLTKEKLYDFLSGEEIFIRLRNEQVDSVFVKSRATSYYHLFEKKENKGINKVLGDEIRMKLRNGKMYKVDVASSPAVSNGVFYPRDRQETVQKELQTYIEQAQSTSRGTSPTGAGPRQTAEPGK